MKTSSIVKLIFKIVIIVAFINFLMTNSSYIVRQTFPLVLSITFIALGFALVKNSFPTLFNVLKRLCFLITKLTALFLWQKPERKGGATVRSHRIRWRQ